MTDPPAPPDPRAPLRDALASWIGARVDAALVTPETGLVALSCYSGERLRLGVGIGPRASGVGVLPRSPRLRATAAHPLAAALRAHLCGRRLLAIEVAPDHLAIVAGGEDAREARLTLAPGRHGEARLEVDGQLVLRWPPRAPRPPHPEDRAEAAPREARWPADPAAAGAALVEQSDAAAAAAGKAALLRAARARRAALERRREAVRGDLERLDRVAELQKLGRLLLAQGARIPRGAARAALDDWEAGGTVEVALDPARPARAQAEDFFAKARRYQRGERAMRDRLAETERALAAVAAIEAEIAAAEADAAALAELATRARALGVAVSAPEPGAGAPARRGGAPGGRVRKPDEAPRRPYHAFRGAGGRAILVGRGGADNDALTTKHARPQDLWLHARGTPGAHVVVPLDRGASCPADLLVDAAMLAVHFSDARGEASFEVTYVPRRHVRKPRGSAPGAVTFTREKVMIVRVDAARLARLLATKDETG